MNLRHSILVKRLRGLLLASTLVALIPAHLLAQGQGQGNDRPPVTGVPSAIPPQVQERINLLRDLRGSRRPGTMENVLESLEGKALAASKAKAHNGDLAGAEAILFSTNSFEPNTALWHLEGGRRLTALAQELSKKFDRPNTTVVVARTLQHLEHAAVLARRAGDTRSEAAAKADAAFLHERFRGDPEAAISSYKAALQLQPNDAMLKEALERLERSLAILRARVEAAKR